MVRKLLKHDFIALLRVVLPMQVIVLGIAILTKVIKTLPVENNLFSAIEITLTVSFVLSALVSAVLTVVMVVVRFYKNLFTNEGYLTFTLPVSPIQHLASKLISSVCSTLISAICIFISVIVLFYQKNLISDSIEILLIIFNRFGEKMLVLEIAILMIISLISTYMLIFTCICLGQRFSKHRIIGAIAIYYGYNLAIQIISTIFIAVTAFTGYIDTLFEIIENMLINCPHIMCLLCIILELIICSVYFIICHNSISKHLNLE